MQQQHAAAEAQQASLLQAFFPGAPMVDMLPAPALGLLTSALAVPGMVLGSLLETNAFPDLGTSAAAPSTTGEYIQSSALTAGEHIFLICTMQSASGNRLGLHQSSLSDFCTHFVCQRSSYMKGSGYQ